MKVVLASANKGKIAEFEKLMPNDEVIAFSEILGKIEIDEDQDSFKGNAIKKARTIYDLLIEKGFDKKLVYKNIFKFLEYQAESGNICLAQEFANVLPKVPSKLSSKG